MRPSAALVSLFAVFAWLSVTPVHAQPLRIVGSDLLEGAVRRDLEGFSKINDAPLSFELRGSRLGLEDLEAGRADLGLLVFSNEDKRPSTELSSSVIGYFTAILIVPQAVTLTQVNYDQVSGVFGASEQNNYRRWLELGALGEWAPRAISAMALGRRTGLSLDLFRYNVLKTPTYKPTVAILETADEAYTRLRGEEGGIAIVPTPPPAGRGLKVLLLAKGAGDVAYGPTAENLHTGDYPVRLPLYLVFRRGAAERVSRVVRHLIADETIPVLLSAGVIALPVQARNQLVFDLETK
jgi:phosphate transport system substrate-binding protein